MKAVTASPWVAPKPIQARRSADDCAATRLRAGPAIKGIAPATSRLPPASVAAATPACLRNVRREIVGDLGIFGSSIKSSIAKFWLVLDNMFVGLSDNHTKHITSGLLCQP